MFLHSTSLRRARDSHPLGEASRHGLEPLDAVPTADPVEAAPRGASPDVLELLLLHGDCAFLLDLREL